ncbi:FHA domain-containing protein [Aquisphaera insulae]|uniref:FHA domain-containing protein n=1 Tax=Aquisphaera insulae TaxID=2712864 RepID=UPI0013EC7D30|nr:FHA domain-containing protein [Aquisphaera insulae]
MNYLLQIVRGRSEATNLKLAPGVNSVGRHDDCLIRIRSSQVSRKHCEVIVNEDKLLVRDLGSANGTYVNGKRVLGQQALKAGDELMVGGVTLRVGQSGATPAPSRPASGAAKPKPSDTSELEALPAEDDVEFAIDDDEEFVVAVDDDDEEAADHIDIIPLDDEPPPPPKPSKKSAPAAAGASPSKKAAADGAGEDAGEPAGSSGAASSKEEEDAVAQFLMDLKLDDE